MDDFKVINRVLLVDDDQKFLNTSKKYLINTKEVFSEDQILTAISKEDAIRQFNEHDDIDILVSDVVMENNLAGLELVKYVRSELRRDKLQIILHTGQAGEIGEIGKEEEELIKEYDINAFVKKGHDAPIKLLSALHSALRSFKLLCKIEEQKKEIEELYFRLKDFTLSQ